MEILSAEMCNRTIKYILSDMTDPKHSSKSQNYIHIIYPYQKYDL